MSDYVYLLIFLVFLYLISIKRKRIKYSCVIKKYNQDGWEFKNDFCKKREYITSYYEELKNNREIEDYKILFEETSSNGLSKLPHFSIDNDEPWYYSFDTKLLYPYKSVVPQPLKNSNPENNFSVNIEIAYYDEENSEDESIEEFEKRLLREYIECKSEDYSEICYDIKFFNNNKSRYLTYNFSENKTELQEFISDVSEKNYAILYSEDKRTSLSVWEVDKDNIRIYIENTYWEIPESTLLLDLIVSKDKFINEMKKVKEQVEYKIRESENTYVPNNF